MLSLRARVSSPDLSGTWGFGLWNDPFTLSFGLKGMARRAPALPNTAWFFFASPPNYLTLRDDLPASGFLAATFRSPRLPGALLALGLPAAPLLGWPAAARLARRVGRRIVRQSAAQLAIDPTRWHTYRIGWQAQRVDFWTDDQMVQSTPVSPQGPLGLVLWIDNQFAAFTPAGKFSMGTLNAPVEAWLEIDHVAVESGD
jgi:hypothetical protein